jgi:hypothetical protein
LWLLLNGFLRKQVQPPFEALAPLLIQRLVAVLHNQVHGCGSVTTDQGMAERLIKLAILDIPGACPLMQRGHTAGIKTLLQLVS